MDVTVHGDVRGRTVEDVDLEPPGSVERGDDREFEGILPNVDVDVHRQEVPEVPIPVAEDLPIPDAANNVDGGEANPNLHNLADEGPGFPDMSRPLFDGASMTQGKLCLAMSNIKTQHNVSQAAMKELYKVIRKAMPAGNVVPKSNYQARKTLCATGLGYEIIHACPNHCLLYRGDALKLATVCPECGEERYKPNTKSPLQVFPMAFHGLFCVYSGSCSVT